ncbi:MAG: hypothetical protein WCT37_04100 [Patescibacteria group bacterium]|jgi:hypothetical protein
MLNKKSGRDAYCPTPVKKPRVGERTLAKRNREAAQHRLANTNATRADKPVVRDEKGRLVSVQVAGLKSPVVIRKGD